MKYISFIFFLLPFIFFQVVHAAPAVSVIPETVMQGEPFMVQIEGAALLDVKKMSFEGKRLNVFSYGGKPSALVGIDLNKKPGTYDLNMVLASGETLTKHVIIGAREKVEAPLGIPAKLGGNTPAARKSVVLSLARENAALNGLRSIKKALWSEKFDFPVANPIVTDAYGYSRKTGEYSIAHKGTDFRAKEGTPVLAMNRGIVRFARETRIYGKTVAVDHGHGVMTLYMHLSKTKVNVGELVAKGQELGLSGKTGYAEAPHLHLSVKIGGVSIDPMKFMELF
ncbi:MAG: M23 family metallopeptidase [bacterium]|nr:M23 family metallopeptidase [bacterium]